MKRTNVDAVNEYQWPRTHITTSNTRYAGLLPSKAWIWFVRIFSQQIPRVWGGFEVPTGENACLDLFGAGVGGL